MIVKRQMIPGNCIAVFCFFKALYSLVGYRHPDMWRKNIKIFAAYPLRGHPKPVTWNIDEVHHLFYHHQGVNTLNYSRFYFHKSAFSANLQHIVRADTFLLLW